jgi:protein gp37
MSTNTGIAWTDATWNPVRGCALVSHGCTNCYAMKQAHRFSGKGGAYEGLTKMTSHGPTWTGKVRCIPELLDVPLRWKKPRRIFVNSMSDLFHEDVPESFIDRVFAVMTQCERHTFQVLTKRPQRMRDYVYDWMRRSQSWLTPNIHLGVSVEDQETANDRIPLLLQTPAAVRFISAEPLLEEVTIFSIDGPIDSYDGMASPLHWVIVGGESGPKARPLDLRWARSIVEQCAMVSVPVFIKQLGGVPVMDERTWFAQTCLLAARNKDKVPAGTVPIALRDRAGADPSEWPADLRVQQFPEARV